MYLFEIRIMHRLKFQRYGDHNVLNALAVIALCHYEEIDVEDIKEQIKNISRRKTTLY